jgi:hypothetical protein
MKFSSGPQVRCDGGMIAMFSIIFALLYKILFSFGRWFTGLASFYLSTMLRVQAKLAVSSLVTLSSDYPKEERPSSVATSCRVDLKLLKLVDYVSVAATPLSLECLATLLQLGSWKDVLTILAPLFTLFPLMDPLDPASSNVAAHPYCLVQIAHKFSFLFI